MQVCFSEMKKLSNYFQHLSIFKYIILYLFYIYFVAYFWVIHYFTTNSYFSITSTVLSGFLNETKNTGFEIFLTYTFIK